MIIEDLEQTCSACPTSWEFTTDDGRKARIRYRWGRLTLWVEENGNDDFSVFSKDPAPVIYSEQIGEGFDGMIEWSEVEKRICDLDVKAELQKYASESKDHQEKFQSDPEYRRSIWRDHIDSIDRHVKAMQKTEKDFSGGFKGLKMVADDYKPWTEEQIIKMLDENEQKFQKGEL